MDLSPKMLKNFDLSRGVMLFECQDSNPNPPLLICPLNPSQGTTFNKSETLRAPFRAKKQPKRDPRQPHFFIAWFYVGKIMFPRH